MGVDFAVFKGSKTGGITEAIGHREPKPTEVIVKISQCGVCGTDEHEIGSSVTGVSDFQMGDRVGMGWFQKFCGYC
ncbi:hypothetical protein B0O99DRAFT_622597 [Bisporella sp. PMI_857]|nr:hypothetical protein B0O99DRAFT_622597 [Bisporella sp. PMI_857]